MAYNTKSIAKDVDGNPVSQYYNPNTDSYEPVEGVSGANKVVLYNEDGTENNKLDLNPILDNLNRLTGSVIDEETRKSNEISRQDSENIRSEQEDARENNEDIRQSNEITREDNELTRENNELVRVANNEVVEGWIANPSQFDGRNIEFIWNGTELGIRLSGDTNYEYVNLKGETGSIENLTEQHVINALGFTPLSEDSLPDNLETTSGSQAKADQAETNAKDYADAGLTDKVDKVTGKGLSTNDYTTAEKNKLNGIAAGAQVNTVTSVAGKTGAVVVSKSDVGLSDVDNIKQATKVEFDEHLADDANPHNTNKLDVGLSNVDNIKQMPISGGILENYREKLVTLSGTSTAINLSLGNTFTHSLTGNTTYSISNAVSGQAHSFTLVINMGATARTLTFPASVKWQGGEIPDLSTTNKTYVLTFMTVDGGTNWLGMFGGEF